MRVFSTLAVMVMAAGCFAASQTTPITTVTSTTSKAAVVPQTAGGEVIPLWSGTVPDARGNDPVKDIPTLTVFRPAAGTANGAAIVVCPGGGYGGLAQHEGKDYALWLNERGITAYVLKYRLGSAGYRHPVMLNDAKRAIRMVRSHAEEWKINPKKIGIIGSSAGGHLASTAATHFDAGDPNATDSVEKVSSRPDLAILCYPVITMGELTHKGSKKNLLGDNPSPELVKLMSNEQQVTIETPPCFVWHTLADKTVNIRNAVMFAEALLNKGVPFDLHIYQNGVHGIGLGAKQEMGKFPAAKLHPWTVDLNYWLKQQGFIQ